jgi:hypothetical protein
MRAGFAAAALATLVLAAPAAAQPSSTEVMRNALEALNRSHGPGVRDYTFTLVHDGVRTPVYVERGDEEWMVHTSEDSPMGSLMSMAVVWPTFLGDGEVPDPEEMGATQYLREERLGGRRVHVITTESAPALEAEGVDSVHLYVDVENHHILRMFVAGAMPEEGGAFAGGDMRLTVDMRDHRETDGVVLPGRLQVRMALQLPEMGAMERAQMTMGLTVLRAQMQGSDEPEAREMLVMLDQFSAVLAGEELDIPMTVEDVVVNAGPPAWLEDET